MTNDPVLGPAFPEFGWVPAPRYLMRRDRILALTADARPGRLLEIGPGAGTLLVEFARRGFVCEALESSTEARDMVRNVAGAAQTDIALHATPGDDWNGRFDCVFAFDVLEHIEDDRAALAHWAAWTRTGGTLVLSVPARMALWTAGDEWAGHFRRYERAALRSLVEDAGFTIERFECYGFPLTNITEKVSARAYRKTMREGAGDEGRRRNNDRSGIDRRPVMRLYPLMKSLPGRLGVRLFTGIQSLSLDRDWGSGYVLRATKR
jgi:SAM-dependent methyltransferase